MATNTEQTFRIEMADGASRCRDFNNRGRQCGNYTRRVVVYERPGRDDVRIPECGKHAR